MKLFRVMALLVAVTGFAISCSKGGDDGGSGGSGGGGGGGGSSCDAVPKTFSADVNPLIQTFCNQAGCHNAGSTNGPGPLTNYAQVFAARTNIRAAVASGIMPKNATLTAAQKASITCWVDSGAPNN